MSKNIEVIELILAGEVVYKRERSLPLPYEKIEFKHYIADSITGKEIK